MTDELFNTIRDEAQEKGWTLVTVIQTHPGGNGYVPHGIVLVRRDIFPFPDREFATLEWAKNEYDTTYLSFFSGHYDLTLEDALDDYKQRIA